MIFQSQIYYNVNKLLNRIIKTPLYIILFTNNNCWLKCRHCWFNENWKKEHLTNNLMSFDEYEIFAKSLKRVLFISFTGGEAFLRDDIVELITMFLKKARIDRYQIPTSGYNPDLIIQKTSKILIKNPDIPLRIDISIDGLHETHDFIRNTKGSFNRAIESLINLNKLKLKFSNLSIGIMTTLSHYNQNELNKLRKYLNSISLEYVWNLIVTRGTPRCIEANDFDIEKYFESKEQIKKYLKQIQYNSNSGYKYQKWIIAKNILRSDYIYDILSHQYNFQGCTAGTMSCVIYTDGSVYPCELLDYPIGNLREFNYNLELLMKSKQADNIRYNIQKNKCICTQECFFPLNIIIQPNNLFKLLGYYFSL